ncbi:unnamed protein product [Hydatigera taeniaeformis]|uniref:N(6)-adenosine-methyltransferase non-catalytic subunit METTL14 n=1 Tax=Hydatigena taeniaeformis TaxID=6205 RepID=A0A0R3X6N5_HYDTA|nr:unnamed protein product [Hydatigera taeniaeformis]
MFAPPGFMMLPEKKPQSKGFPYDLFENPYKWMAEPTYLSPSSSLECCRLRLAKRRRRQTQIRRLILNHLNGDASVLSDSIHCSNGFEEALHQCALLKTLKDRLKYKSFGNGSFDESAAKKSLIFPMLRTIQPLRLSNSILRLLHQGLDGLPLSQGYSFNKGRLVRRGGENNASSFPTSSSDLSRNPDSREGLYLSTSTFLKGTQSANPHNDYCQHFVDTGKRPQNFIRDTGLRNRFEEYPKLRELIRLKDELIQSRVTPPMYLRVDLRTFNLQDLNSVFDVILVEPPLDRSWSWQEIEALEIEKIAASRSFIWIWCGSGEGLDGARRVRRFYIIISTASLIQASWCRCGEEYPVLEQCLKKWGFRRCEDICWIKTNKTRPCHEQLEPGAVLQRTKEHCLMGIHGTVRRSVDGDFIHANLDIDLIISEAKVPGTYGDRDKPTEIFHIIEHFCLGRRRLHLFGRDSTLRAGWLTLGSELSASNFDSQVYTSYFTREPNGHLVGSSDEIERLRPKSPPPIAAVWHSGSANTMGQQASRTALSQPTVTPSLLGKPTACCLQQALPQALPHHRAMGAVDQSALLNLLSLSAQNCLTHPLLPSLVGQSPRPEGGVSTENLASLQTALLLRHPSQSLHLQLAPTSSCLGDGDKMALAMQMFAAAASSLQPGDLRNTTGPPVPSAFK